MDDTHRVMRAIGADGSEKARATLSRVRRWPPGYVDRMLARAGNADFCSGTSRSLTRSCDPVVWACRSRTSAGVSPSPGDVRRSGPEWQRGQTHEDGVAGGVTLRAYFKLLTAIAGPSQRGSGRAKATPRDGELLSARTPRRIRDPSRPAGDTTTTSSPFRWPAPLSRTLVSATTTA